MIELKNLKQNNNIIEYDIYPEDSKEPGKVCIDCNTKEMVSYSLPNGYEWCISHIHHAKRAIISMLESNDLQNEKTVMWY